MSRRRELAELVVSLVVLAGVWIAVHYLVSQATQHAYFGLPNGAVWSNLIASAICAVLVFWRLRTQALRHHAEQLAQQARHNRERTEQADRTLTEIAGHVADLKKHADKHAQQALDRADVHAEAIKAHVSTTAKPRSRGPRNADKTDAVA